jgi:hypothetical protein
MRGGGSGPPRSGPPTRRNARRLRKLNKKPKDSALVWTDLGNASPDDQPYHAYEADDGRGGKYHLAPTSHFPSFTFGGYHVEHVENPDAEYRDQKRRTLTSGVKTAAKAKDIALTDYNKRLRT